MCCSIQCFSFVRLFVISSLLLFITACGGGGGGNDGGDDRSPSKSLKFLSDGPIVTVDNSTEIDLSLTVNLDDVDVSYLITSIDSDLTPNVNDYFSDAVPAGFKRYGFHVNQAETEVVDSIPEKLIPLYQYRVFVAIRSAETVVEYPESFAITMKNIGITQYQSKHCPDDEDSVWEGNFQISNQSDWQEMVSSLQGIKTLNGSILVEGSEAPQDLKLEGVVCVRDIEVFNHDNLVSIEFPDLKVTESLVVYTESESAMPAFNTLNMPNLLSSIGIAIENTSSLKEFRLPSLEIVEFLELNENPVLESLIFPNLRAVVNFSMRYTDVSDMTTMDSLYYMYRVILVGLSDFSLDFPNTVRIDRLLSISNVSGLENLGNVTLGELDRFSMIDVPLNGENVYLGDIFSANTLILSRTDIQSLNGLLDKTDRIDELLFLGNSALETIEVQQAEPMESLRVIANPNLKSISVPNAKSITELHIGDHTVGDEDSDGNPELLSASFMSLEKVSDMVFVDNLKLAILEMPLLGAVENNNSSNRCDFVGLAVTEMTFESLESAYCRFWFHQNSMSSLSFPKLTQLNSGIGNIQEFEIGDINDSGKGNPDLEDISFPLLNDTDEFVFYIGNNDSLSDIAMPQLDSIRAINIIDNSDYSQCEAENLYQRLGGGGLEPSGNRVCPR